MQAPASLDLDKLKRGEYSQEEIDAYNQAKRDELDARIHQADEEMRDAARLIADTTRDIPTDTVGWKGVDFTVYLEATERMENLYERFQRLQNEDAPLDEVKDVASQLVASLIHTPKDYQDARVWILAARQSNGGTLEYLREATQTLQRPMTKRNQRLKKKQRRAAEPNA